MGEEAYMIKKEVHRAEIFARIAHKQITKTEAAKELNLSLRQVLRLYGSFKKVGRDALRSRKRGKPSNHQMSKEVKDQVADLISRDIYKGFRPTIMSEKLYEIHGIKISRETVRQIMLHAGTWKSNSKKRPVVHQQRKRRARYGELVQIDGSPHDWFEGRGERCTLLVYIDDATGRTFGKFAEVESTEAYMDITRDYILQFGLPRSFYSDKHSTFRVNRENCLKKDVVTQFGRSLRELEIELICANSPQAKGRVERANLTLQDRLVKEMRLAGISSIEEANKFLKTENYWDKHNRRFSVPPISTENAHRECPSKMVLDRVFCFKSTRKLTRNFELQYKNSIYQICPEDQLRGLLRAQVTVLEKLDGTISIEFKGKKIGFRMWYEQDFVGKEVDSKEIERFLKGRRQSNVPLNHPWKGKRSLSYSS
jgi:hypothetical protein